MVNISSIKFEFFFHLVQKICQCLLPSFDVKMSYNYVTNISETTTHLQLIVSSLVRSYKDLAYSFEKKCINFSTNIKFIPFVLFSCLL